MQEEKLLPTEIVASILSNLPGKKKKLPTELRKIHPIFFSMRNSGIGILQDFSFDNRGTFPYSSTIDQALSNLETSRVLGRTNPDLDKYVITQGLKNYYQRYIKNKLDSPRLEEVKKVARELSQIATK